MKRTVLLLSFALVLGYIGLRIAFYGEANSPTNALETRAIGGLRAIQEAEPKYYSAHHRYATLTELGSLIDKNLATGTTGGYKFVITAGPTEYTVNADPISFGSSGRRTFFSDQTMAVHPNFGPEPAGLSSPTLQ